MTDLVRTGFVFGQERTPDLNKGLIFLYQRDLIVTGNFWNIAVNLDLKWYRTQPVTQQEISYLYSVWEQLNSELADVEKLLPMTRRKRGPLNFDGDVLHFLFGTAIVRNCKFYTRQ